MRMNSMDKPSDTENLGNCIFLSFYFWNAFLIFSRSIPLNLSLNVLVLIVCFNKWIAGLCTYT